MNETPVGPENIRWWFRLIRIEERLDEYGDASIRSRLAVLEQDRDLLLETIATLTNKVTCLEAAVKIHSQAIQRAEQTRRVEQREDSYKTAWGEQKIIR